ncbi:inorganic phosphate transporter [uncultured Tenacibaculum sp.]|uniref:inorganic phosphate transporter n=1 Tax=uncultured Tenacibaculum sp. TaxID=174713 RepID=UPI0026176134|nr:inorganic phosphate transporter [uncultured Tenacibaculum sp.]
MGDPFILMLVALGALAILDLVVGVSNDAVNFLNSAIGSKAIPIKTIMIIASVGVFFGAVSSSGMMEVARKGIFNPNMFMFEEIMYIFMAVMITDILLLDIFNSLGMPTSTTVSIVFELLGAAVAIALIKISGTDQSVTEIWNYINYETASKIILGIILSVVVAFSVGAIVQYFSRIIYSFEFEKKPVYINVLFGGFAITAITYFIIIKGLKGTHFYGNIKDLIEGNSTAIIAGSFALWSAISLALIKFFKINILTAIIAIGTFSLAMAFAGNDLVNFIGVPIAALNSYNAWQLSGEAANEFSMGILAEKVPSNVTLLLVAGAIMVITLWTSKKARAVIETGINLSRQGDGHEKFRPNNLSRIVVRAAMFTNLGFNTLIPEKTRNYINSKFEKPVIKLPKDKTYELPAFDLVRAAVNLIMASILISIATSMKLPLSTTYVTFMVAMGTSLADRAWGRESAVYRVAGVLNVIGGWFLTAIIAFTAAAIVASLISWHQAMIPVLLLVVIAMLVRTTIQYSKKNKEEKQQQFVERAELLSINEIIDESSEHIANVAQRVNKLYSNVVNDLATHDLNKLRKTEKHVLKLNEEIENLKNGVFYFIKSLDDTSVKASKFYILILSYLQDVTQSISYISKITFNHVNNNHKNLKKSQLKDLKNIDNKLSDLLTKVSETFDQKTFDNLTYILDDQKDLTSDLYNSIENQVDRIRTDETSPKNTTLYFSILLETQDLVGALVSLLENCNEFYISTKSTSVRI